VALLLAIKKIGKPTMTADLADIDQDAETPKDEVYNDELEGTGHVSDANADADAATLEDLITKWPPKSTSLLVMHCNMGK